MESPAGSAAARARLRAHNALLRTLRSRARSILEPAAPPAQPRQPRLQRAKPFHFLFAKLKFQLQLFHGQLKSIYFLCRRQAHCMPACTAATISQSAFHHTPAPSCDGTCRHDRRPQKKEREAAHAPMRSSACALSEKHRMRLCKSRCCFTKRCASQDTEHGMVAALAASSAWQAH